jgi:hypothetical protein
VEPEIRLVAKRMINQQVAFLTTYLTAATQLVVDPTHGTPARTDRDHVSSHPRPMDMELLWGLTNYSCANDIRSAREHLRGVATLIAADDLMPLPTLAVARSVYEAALNTCWLLDADVGMELRLARWAGRVLHDSQEGPNTLAGFGPSFSAQKERARVTQGREQTKEFLTRAGFELTAKGGGRSDEIAKVTYQGASSGVTPKLVDSMARYTPNQRELLYVFSGATHSRGWLTQGLAGRRTDLIAMVLLPLLDTSDALVVEVAKYFGLKPRSMVERTHMHRRVLMHHVRPSDLYVAGVDEYRAAGGAPPLP